MAKKRTPPPPALIPPLQEVELPPALAFTPVPRRTKRWNGLTPLKQRAFIANLASCGCVEMAGASVGSSGAAFYTLRKAEGAESFAAAWEVAVDMGARIVLDKLMEHAIHGTPEKLLKDGEVILERRKYNTRAMMWIVQQRFPETYGGSLSTGGAPNSMPHALRKLKAKWEAEWLEAYKAEQSAIAEAKAQEEEATREIERRELLPVILVKHYQRKVREERNYRLTGQTTHADMTLRQLTHIELYMEFAGLVEPEIMAFFDNAEADPHPWESEASKAITAHREAAWAMDLPALRPPLVRHSLGDGGRPMDSALRGGSNFNERTKARAAAERQMAEAQALWEACATEESWANRPAD